MKRLLVAFGSGGLFSVGLAVSGMTQPQKVIAFLDFTGDWDPSLALVMGGALAVYVPAYILIRRRRRTPIFSRRFVVPVGEQIDARLVSGATLFGVGWGIAGFCPGPAIVSLAGLTPAALVFMPAMVVGALLVRWSLQRRAAIRGAGAESTL